MDKAVEQSFVKTFINKSNQERILYELSSKEKRQNALSKFSHNASNYLREKYIILQGDKLNNDILSKEIRRLPIKTCQCYIISESYCGFIISLEEALNFVFDNYSASILIIDNIIAVIKEESEKSVAQKYLLYKHG